jgi:hypothetical protein
MLALDQVAMELRRRLVAPFLPDGSGRRACHGEEDRFAGDPDWRDLVLFHEYFHAETGRGLGASHQTGWTALAAPCLESLGRATAAGTGSEVSLHCDSGPPMQHDRFEPAASDDDRTAPAGVA